MRLVRPCRPPPLAIYPSSLSPSCALKRVWIKVAVASLQIRYEVPLTLSLSLSPSERNIAATRRACAVATARVQLAPRPSQLWALFFISLFRCQIWTLTFWDAVWTHYFSCWRKVTYISDNWSFPKYNFPLWHMTHEPSVPVGDTDAENGKQAKRTTFPVLYLRPHPVYIIIKADSCLLAHFCSCFHLSPHVALKST